MMELGQDLHDSTEGKLSIKLYGGGVAGDEIDIVRKMRIGQFQMAAITDKGLNLILPEINIFRLPLIFNSDGELEYVLEHMHSKLDSLFRERGFVVLGWGVAGWAYLFTQKPVIYPNDLIRHNQKIFVWSGGAEWFRAWRAGGFHPVGIAVPDIFISLQTGHINTFTATPLLALSFQWFALANNMTDLAFAPVLGGIVISKKVWDSLPASYRSLLRQMALEKSKNVKSEIIGLDQKAVDIMKTHGLVVHDIPEDARNEWSVLVETRLHQEFLPDDRHRAFFEEVKSLINTYRQENPVRAEE